MKGNGHVGCETFLIRVFLRASTRSLDSFNLYESASMVTISDLCIKRSIKEITQEAFGKIWSHSTNGLLVVMMVDLFYIS
mgnify:CR=1 FL=1